MVTPGLLGRHKRRGPRDIADLGLIGTQWSRWRGVFKDNVGLIRDLAESPVHHQHLAEGADHHVGRLDVAVQHSSAVGEGNGVADLTKDEEPFDQRAGCVGVDPLGEGLPNHFFHGEKGTAGWFAADVVDGHHIGVVELPGDLSLAQKAESGRVVGIRRCVELERHGTLHFAVKDREHDSVAALAQQPLLPVAVWRRPCLRPVVVHSVREVLHRFVRRRGTRAAVRRHNDGGLAVGWGIVVCAHSVSVWR